MYKTLEASEQWKCWIDNCFSTKYDYAGSFIYINMINLKSRKDVNYMKNATMTSLTINIFFLDFVRGWKTVEMF